ncbi:unnamed protein product [Rhodiola kirilowii]
MGEITGKLVYDVLTTVRPTLRLHVIRIRLNSMVENLNARGVFRNQHVRSVLGCPVSHFQVHCREQSVQYELKFLGRDALQKVLTLTLVLIGQRFFQRSDGRQVRLGHHDLLVDHFVEHSDHGRAALQCVLWNLCQGVDGADCVHTVRDLEHDFVGFV